MRSPAAPIPDRHTNVISTSSARKSKFAKKWYVATSLLEFIPQTLTL